MAPKSPPISEVRLEVPFHDLDPLSVVWHGNYFKYFDVARDALFRDRGIDLFDYYQKAGYVFPVTKTSVKYVQPLRFRDEFIVRAELVEARIKIVINFEIYRVADGTVCTKGRSEQAAVRVSDMELELMIPREIRTALGEA